LKKKRRQDQDAGGAGFDRVFAQVDRIGDGAGAGARHQPLCGNPCVQDCLGKVDAFVHRQGCRLRIRAEDCEAHALAHQPAAMVDEKLDVRPQLRVERRQDRG